MQVKTKSNLISYYDNSYIRQDGQPVNAYKVQIGQPGEAALDLPLDEEVYNRLAAKKVGYTENVDMTLNIRMFGNKVSVRCVEVGL